jgi:ribosomal protein L24
MVKRHQKATGQDDPGGIIEREASLHISNLMEESRYNTRRSK